MDKVIFTTNDRTKWREWLSINFENEKDVWFMFPTKESGETSISYNDAVEEALCFGWIDSTIKNLDSTHRIQHFTPRTNQGHYSRPNIERLIWLDKQGMIHPKIRPSIEHLISEEYIFPEDIIENIKRDQTVWENYERFPEGYKRIRIAYIDDARRRPDEFDRRLNNFIEKTRQGKMIRGFGGIEKYYNM